MPFQKLLMREKNTGNEKNEIVLETTKNTLIPSSADMIISGLINRELSNMMIHCVTPNN